MTELSRAVALSGALDEDMLREFGKWRLPIEVPDDAPFESPEEAITAIEEALESANQVEIRATDLDILKQFLRTQRNAKLHLVTSHESGTFDISIGVTTLGEYIIPWRKDGLVEVLTNGESHIIDGRRRIFLSGVQDLYFGDTKVFILCTPIRNANGKLGHKS